MKLKCRRCDRTALTVQRRHLSSDAWKQQEETLAYNVISLGSLALNIKTIITWLYICLIFYFNCVFYFFCLSFHTQWSATSGPRYARRSSWRSGRLFRFWRRVKVGPAAQKTRSHSARLLGSSGNQGLEGPIQWRHFFQTLNCCTCGAARRSTQMLILDKPVLFWINFFIIIWIS